MIVVFALLAIVSGQPGGPWMGGYNPQPTYGRNAPPEGPVNPPAAPSQFDIDQERMNVRSERDLVPGNDAIINLVAPTYASIEKVQGNEIQVRRIRKARQHLLDGTPDPNALDDLDLQRVAAQNQVNRRESELFGATPLPGLFEGRAHQAQLVLAQNQRADAAQAFAKDPSRDNWNALRDARDNIEQQQEWLDANKYDVFGFGSSLATFAPLKRVQASRTALDIGQRSQRINRAKYAANPTEDNWWDLRLSNIQLEALKKDEDANKGEAIFKLGTIPSAGNFELGALLQAQSFDNEEDIWQRYHRMALRNLQRKQAQGGVAGANPVQAQLLALNNYGPGGLPPAAPRAV